MIAFVRRFACAWRVARSFALSPQAPPWGRDDALALHNFLASPEGIRLGAVLREKLARDATAAITANPDRLPWACGHAAGMQSMVAHLDALAVDPAPVEPATDDRPSDSLDWLHTANTARQNA